MLTKRIIGAIQLTSDGTCCYGEQSPSELGDYYTKQGADEIVLFYPASSIEDFTAGLKEVAQAVTIPLTAGGIVRTQEDFGTLIDCGADKVLLDQLTEDFLPIIAHGAQHYGNQAVVALLRLEKQEEGYALANVGSRHNEVAWWIAQLSQAGIGELVVSFSQDELDMPQLKKWLTELPFPLIIALAQGEQEQIEQIFQELPGLDAIVEGKYLAKGKVLLPSLKQALKKQGLPIRLLP